MNDEGAGEVRPVTPARPPGVPAALWMLAVVLVTQNVLEGLARPL
jgi:hypothetical protein